MSIDVDAARKQHRRNRMGNCTVDRQRWPCEILRAADEIAALRARDPMAIVGRILTPAVIGESVHTALRKCDAVTDTRVYEAINNMPDGQWHAAMEWAAEVLLEYVEREAAEARS